MAAESPTGPTVDPSQEAVGEALTFGSAPLPEREALLRAILETSPDGLITIDEDGIIQSFNPAAERMFGYQAIEVSGATSPASCPRPIVKSTTITWSTSGAPARSGSSALGAKCWDNAATVRSFPGARGRRGPGGRAPVVRRVREGRERASAERAPSARAAVGADSRRAPQRNGRNGLGPRARAQPTAHRDQTARGLVERREGKAVGGLASLLDKTVQQAGRAGQIIRRLRQFIAKGETDRALEDINSVVEEASALALVGTKGKGIAARRVLGDGLPPVLLDTIQIHQVITNLIRNSVDALDGVQRREIVISTRQAGQDSIEITVADTGPGLAPELADRLFQPFVTTKPTGLGIGLSICRSIVDAHGGRLFASDNPGGGMIFHVHLPTAEARGERGG